MSSLSDRLKSRRKDLHLSQDQLGEKIGKDQKQIWQYETGRTVPSADVIAELAHALQTTTDYLLGLTEYSDRPLRGVGDLSKLERETIGLLRRAPEETQERIVRVIRELV